MRAVFSALLVVFVAGCEPDPEMWVEEGLDLPDDEWEMERELFYCRPKAREINELKEARDTILDRKQQSSCTSYPNTPLCVWLDNELLKVNADLAQAEADYDRLCR